MINSLDKNLTLLSPTGPPVLLDVAPWLRFSPPGTFPYNTLKGLDELAHEAHTFFEGMIKDRFVSTSLGIMLFKYSLFKWIKDIWHYEKYHMRVYLTYASKAFSTNQL